MIEPATSPNQGPPATFNRSLDELPLPNLPEGLLHEIKIARRQLEEKLCDELHSRWAKWLAVEGLPKTSPETLDFTEPFVNYGVGLYDAYGGIYLKLNPNLADYLNWMDFGLKTQILEEIAPCWSADQLEEASKFVPQRPLPIGAWECWMRHSYRLTDHPERSRLPPVLLHQAFERGARELITALRDPLYPYWKRFLGLLHNALSRKTPHWATEATKHLTKPEALAAEGPCTASAKAAGDGQDTAPEPLQETRAQRSERRRRVVMPILERKHRTRSWLSTDSGAGRATVYGYLDGSRTFIRDDNRQVIAQSLEIDLKALPE